MNKEYRDKARIYLNEYNVLLSNTLYLPLASGLLQAYAQTKPDIYNNYEFMPINYKRDNPDKIMATFGEPAVAAFSVSSWNEQLCLTVAERVKEKFPECLIVFGGPQVPFEANEYFDKHKFIDISVRGEGERAFAEILIRFLSSRDFKGISGTSYRDSKTGKGVKNLHDQPTLPDNNLDIFPSPYLEGVFASLMKMGIKWQVIIETNRGCPFPCAYCFWGQAGLNSKFRYFSLERVEREIDWCGSNNIQYLFCADSNFGMLKRDEEIVKILARTKKKYNCPERFRVNYGKNTDDRIFDIARYLHEHELEKAITISFQSFNEKALSNVNRHNIQLSSFQRLQEKYIQYNIPTYSEMILGLPGETYESWINGLEQCLSAGIKNNIFVYLCQVLPNTTMADKEYLKKHGITTVKMPLHEGHGAVRTEDDVIEYENVVVKMDSMPQEDWKRSAVFSWVMQAFVGLKLGFFILIYLKEKYQIKYTDILQYISNTQRKFGNADFISENISRLWKIAIAITNGDPKTVVMEDFGNIYWEPEEYFYFNISNGKDKFYDELLEIIVEYLNLHNIGFDKDELKDVFTYQRTRIPQYTSLENREISFEYNVPEYFDRYFINETSKIKKAPQYLKLNGIKNFDGDKKTFARDIVLYGRKGNQLLHPITWKSADSADWKTASF